MYFIKESYLSDLLVNVQECDEQAVCHKDPTTYFNAVWPVSWDFETEYVIGDIIRPQDFQGFVYECTVSGTSGSVLPGWGTTQDQTFTDGSVTWKTHENYSLVNTSRQSTEYTISDYSQSGETGKIIVLATKENIIIHTTGVASSVALICSTDKTVRIISVATTTLPTDELVSGRTTVFNPMSVLITQPIRLI